MRQRVISMLAPLTKRRPDKTSCYKTKARGLAVLNSPQLNNGTAFGTPPARAAANPADLIAWTSGRALIVTGSSFAPMTHKGVTYVIGQANNTMLYPGLALGAIVSRASRLSDGRFAAAAAVAEGLAGIRFDDIVQQVQDAMWQPEYREIEAC